MSDNVTDLTVHILQAMREDLGQIRVELQTLNRRIEGLVDAGGAGRRNHEARIAGLETRISVLEKRRK